MAAIVLVGPRLAWRPAEETRTTPAECPPRLVRERLRQIGEQVDLRDRLGAARHSGLDGAATADFDVRLVLDARVQGALAVLLGRHERLLVLRDSPVQDDAVDAFPVERQVLRAYDEGGAIIGRELVEAGEDHVAAAERPLADPAVAFLHTRNVVHGCYMLTVRRS